MTSLFTFALGAVSALVLVPIVFNSKYRHRHRHGGPARKTVARKKSPARGGKGGGRKGK